MAFHRAIVEASGNGVLLRSWEGLGFEIRTRIRLVASSIDLVKTPEDHWGVIEAIKAANSRAVGKLLYGHVSRFARERGNS